MTVLGVRLAGPPAGAHPALLRSRRQNLTATAVTALVALGLAFAIVLSIPEPSVLIAVGIVATGLAVFALMISPRYEVTVTILVLYLGLLDGPVKLLTASRAASTVRDILIFAVVVGGVARLFTAKQRIPLPALAAWVIAFTVSVIAQAFNPHTHGLLKILGGFRQELEWVPFFFFAYLLIRSKQRFRQMFLILGVIALANGVVSAYQSRLSPSQLASWGPGYSQKINGSAGVAKRLYVVEGEAHIRPPGLASDAGGGGGLGVLALPGLLAMLSVGGLRKKWPVALCFAGAALGIASAGSRSSVAVAVGALVAYALLSLIAHLRVTRLILTLLIAVGLIIAAGDYLIAENGPSVVKRQETLTSTTEIENSGGRQKLNHLEALPRVVTGAPLGSGLGTTAAAAGFGGKQKVIIEGRGASGEASLNLLAIEVGVPGLLLWVGLSLNVIWLVLTRVRNIEDPELRTYLVAIGSSFIAHTASGLIGPSIVSVGGVFQWFAAGIVAYWLAGPGWQAARRRWRKPPPPLNLAYA
jgi:hypothetical protein